MNETAEMLAGLLDEFLDCFYAAHPHEPKTVLAATVAMVLRDKVIEIEDTAAWENAKLREPGHAA